MKELKWKLQEHDYIKTAYTRYVCSAFVVVVIGNSATGKIREEVIRRSEMNDEIIQLYHIAATVGEQFASAVERRIKGGK